MPKPIGKSTEDRVRSGARVRIEYDKTSAPVTAHEVLALDFLARRGLLPKNPITPPELLVTLGGMPPPLRAELAAVLRASPDEGAGILGALRVGEA